MTSNVIPFPRDAVTLKDGHPITTSLAVAEVFGKQHSHVLRDIRELECSDKFRLSNFGQSSYINQQGKAQPLYDIQEDGWMMLVMGFNGPEAARIKEAYIAAFNEMKRALDGIAEVVRQPDARRDQINIPKDDYIELLQAQVKLLKGERPEKLRKPAPIPLSDDEKLHIINLHEQNMGKADIARAVGRSRSAVRSVIREFATT